MDAWMDGWMDIIDSHKEREREKSNEREREFDRERYCRSMKSIFCVQRHGRMRLLCSLVDSLKDRAFTTTTWHDPGVLPKGRPYNHGFR